MKKISYLVLCGALLGGVMEGWGAQNLVSEVGGDGMQKVEVDYQGVSDNVADAVVAANQNVGGAVVDGRIWSASDVDYILDEMVRLFIEKRDELRGIYKDYCNVVVLRYSIEKENDMGVGEGVSRGSVSGRDKKDAEINAFLGSKVQKIFQCCLCDLLCEGIRNGLPGVGINYGKVLDCIGRIECAVIDSSVADVASLRKKYSW